MIENLISRLVVFLGRVKPMLDLLWRVRKKLLIINATVAVVSVLILLLFVKPYYKSTVTILPEYGNKAGTLSGLAEIASLAGVSIGESSPTEIYENILMSEAVLGPAFYLKYKTEEYRDSVNLFEYFGMKPDESLSPSLQQRKLFVELYRKFTESRINTDVDPVTKILTLTVKMPESQLSADVANNIVESLDKYIRTKRKSYASNQRFYLDMRVSQVKDSLTAAEQKLEEFQTNNRIVEQSPELILEQGRLTRTIEVLQNIYIQITGQLELAKIDEIKDAPVLNVKELALDPVKKAGPPRIFIELFIIILSVVISMGYYVYEESIATLWSTIKKEFQV